jgi:spermidine dehydrogenase
MSGRSDHHPTDETLGMNRRICRRDFLNAALLGSGGILLSGASPTHLLAQQAPEWDGYGGVGDYRNCHGNTLDVMDAGHQLRDQPWEKLAQNITDTGEILDCVVVGGGLSGLSAALYFRNQAKSSWSCLVLDNHCVFGGFAKRNEFVVNGQRLIAQQGSTQFQIPYPRSFWAQFYESIGLDWRAFKYQTWQAPDPEIPLSRTPYQQYLGDSAAFYFGGSFADKPGIWITDPWGTKLEGAPLPANVRAELVALHGRKRRPLTRPSAAEARRLDSITLEDTMVENDGLSRETIRKYLGHRTAAGSGLGPDALSGYVSHEWAKLRFLDSTPETGWQMFPGGNAGMARLIGKTLLPESIAGPRTLEAVCRNNINFEALDRAGSPTRIRLGATVIGVEHEGDPATAEFVRITYVREGKVYRLKARSAIMAGGSWTTKHIVRDLPAAHRDAYSQFYRCPYLVANVALTNWRFLYKRGVSAVRWFGGAIGDWTEVRKTATFGPAPKTIGPDSPVVVTLKVAFLYPGLPTREQGEKGRAELMSIPYREYERRIREQFTDMFAATGFDARRDIAGVILNRWGHAFITPQPGFFFGKDGLRAPRDILSEAPFGRIAFANTDLAGTMDHRAATRESQRAVGQIVDYVLT